MKGSCSIRRIRGLRVTRVSYRCDYGSTRTTQTSMALKGPSGGWSEKAPLEFRLKPRRGKRRAPHATALTIFRAQVIRSTEDTEKKERNALLELLLDGPERVVRIGGHDVEQLVAEKGRNGLMRGGGQMRGRPH